MLVLNMLKLIIILYETGLRRKTFRFIFISSQDQLANVFIKSIPTASFTVFLFKFQVDPPPTASFTGFLFKLWVDPPPFA